MTKAEIQALIDNIDTTGNQGTTGQELKDIYEAFKNELDDYIEINISSYDIQSIDSVPILLLPAPNVGEEFQFRGMIKFYQNGVAFNNGELVIYRNDFAKGIRIEKTFLSGSDKIVCFSSENFIQDNVLIDTTTKPVLIPQPIQQPLAMFSTDYFGVGNGSLKIMLWYKAIPIDL